MVSADQFRELVSEYLRGVIELDSFSNRFAVLFDDVEDSNDAPAIQMAYQIESHLADVSAGFSSETVLREALIPCLLVIDIDPESRAPQQTVRKSETSAPYSPAEVSFA
jgi:hypothetical protein